MDQPADTVTMTVSVTTTAEVQVPAAMVPDHLPKRLHHWPDELLEKCAAGWSATTDIDRSVYDAGDVEITSGSEGPLADPSTY